jgi:hypothetical protein
MELKKKHHVIGALAVIRDEVYVQVDLLVCVFLFDESQHLVQVREYVVDCDCVLLPIHESLH